MYVYMTVILRDHRETRSIQLIPGNSLQHWPELEEQVAEAQAFTSFATSIEQTPDLTWLAEPCSVIKGKLIRRAYDVCVRKVTECTFLGPLGCIRSETSISEAKEKIQEEVEGSRLLRDLKDWRRARLTQLQTGAYGRLEDATAFAWNLWVDKLMDHVRTVYRLKDIKAAAENLVSCSEVCHDRAVVCY